MTFTTRPREPTHTGGPGGNEAADGDRRDRVSPAAQCCAGPPADCRISSKPTRRPWWGTPEAIFSSGRDAHTTRVSRAIIKFHWQPARRRARRLSACAQLLLNAAAARMIRAGDV